MNQKAEKPILSGQRIKTRKRDEKEKHDPIGFRNTIIIGLENCSEKLDFEAIYKFLDTSGGKLDYKRYGECLFDILIAGDLLASSGSAISQDGEGPTKTERCIFGTPNDIDMNLLKNWEQVFLKLMRRYKYLEVMFFDEIKKILTFLKCFSVENRTKLSIMMYLWLSNNSIPFSALYALSNPHLIKDYLAINFLVEIFKWWRQDKGLNSLQSAIKKAAFDSHLMDFVSNNTQSHQYFRKVFEDANLKEILKLYNDQHQQMTKKHLQQQITTMLKDERTFDDILSTIKEVMSKENISEQEIISIVWSSVMSSQDWSKKEELLHDQAVKHLRTNANLFKEFSTQEKSEQCLLLKIQEFCYTNVSFLRLFNKIVVVFYKYEILSEVTIVKWYKSENTTGKGKLMFMDQMKQFIEWLQSAEEETDSE